MVVELQHLDDIHRTCSLLHHHYILLDCFVLLVRCDFGVNHRYLLHEDYHIDALVLFDNITPIVIGPIDLRAPKVPLKPMS